MARGSATIRLPFPEVHPEKSNRRGGPWREHWSTETWREKQRRENWKRFKRLCSMLHRDGLQYDVAFHFEPIKVEQGWRDRTVDGLRVEISWQS